MQADIIPVGKWPEGLAFDGSSMWIAESGIRQIARLALDDNRVTQQVHVGALPVHMVGGDRSVFTLVHTARMIWAQGRGGGRQLARLEGCPAAMSGDYDYLWVVTWPQCSDDYAELIRVDPATGRTSNYGSLGNGSTDVANGLGKVWVLHTKASSTIIEVDQTARTKRDINIPGAQLRKLAIDGDRLFAAGMQGQQGIVLAFNPQTGQETARRVLQQPIQVVLPTTEHVLALGKSGTIWVLSPTNLAILREIRSPFGVYEPMAAATAGGRLYITTHKGQGDNGSVLALRNWEP